jgi:sugar (pentulose or hexulose) kinase
MTLETILTVDAGTSRLKAAVYNTSGDQLAFAARRMTVLHPFDGACEMDMRTVWDALVEVCFELAETAPEAWNALTAVAISGQGDGLWPVDAAGEPVGNAILWNDTRCKRLDLPNETQITAFGMAHSTSPLFVGAPTFILRWMQVFEPARFARVRHALHCKDWLVYRLTGRIMTDRSDASTALMNILKDGYEFDLLGLLGLPAATAQVFPEIVGSMEMVGSIGPAAAAACRLRSGLPVMAGALDVAAATFGAGARQPGDAVTILGTTFSNQVILSAGQVSHADVAGSTLCYLYPDTFMRVLATTNGASVIDWARKTFLPDLPLAEIENGLTEVAAGAEGIFFQPYLNGERAPFRESRAAGAFHGITPRHNAYHLMRAVFEGLAYSLKDCYTHLPAGETPVILAGGASASKTLCQTCADALQRPMLRVPEQEFGLYGMACALLETLGRTPVQPAALTHGELFTPREEAAALYQAGFEIYRQLRQSAMAFWQARDQFLGRLPGSE